MLSTALRPVRNNVFVISRTITSKRFASTAVSTAPSPPVSTPARFSDCSYLVVTSAPGCSCRARHSQRHSGRDDDGGARLGHEQRPRRARVPGAKCRAVEDRNLDLALLEEVRRPASPAGRSIGARAATVGQWRRERPRDESSAALQDLDPLAGIADREDPLVEVMELVDDAARRRPVTRSVRSPSGSSSVHTWSA